ncbi:Hypothetical protein I596_3676 [Dokdonella koreensis DS-123]|uniref:Uncharacterized protein n=1 Tax=Dokdonella koreensis DS-123 TaxID=1300342 RepID=A0A160DY09_9GAMM|nr:Hypothetical protein I596_3676 [Dokdonella koreensis DS-123]
MAGAECSRTFISLAKTTRRCHGTGGPPSQRRPWPATRAVSGAGAGRFGELRHNRSLWSPPGTPPSC